MKKITTVILVIFLCGCGSLYPWRRMKDKVYTYNLKGYEVKPPVDWMKYNTSKHYVITKDGIALNHIVIDRKREKDDLNSTKKKFSLDMMPQDLAEVEIDDLNADENSQEINIIVNEPAEIDGIEAFKIKYTYVNPDGLVVKGDRYGFVYGKYVYRIWYEAPKQHYYAQELKAFNEFLASFKLLKK